MVTEQQLLTKMDISTRTMPVVDLFRQLLCFWQSFTLHKRTCAKTGKEMISVFGESCPYPVWLHDEWLKHANPPDADFQFEQGFFDQLWQLFQQCPIPHNMGNASENCDYTDDCWYSKKCYLSHSVLRGEDIYYSYRVIDCRNCFFCVFSNNCELCLDVVNSTHCYNVTYAIDCAQCRDSAFLFDCRNCSDCILCFNLRNKQYCIENVQYTKEEYEEKKKQYTWASRKSYEEFKKQFRDLLFTKAWWKAQHNERVEHVNGDYIREGHNCDQVFFVDKCKDVVNFVRGLQVKDCVNCIGCFNSELLGYCSMVQDGGYEVFYSVNLVNCKFMEYSINCTNCEHCFACAGLVNRQFCILNKQYSEQEYHELKQKIKSHLKETGEYGQLFPGYFASCTYDESLAAFYFPLTLEQQKILGFRTNTLQSQNMDGYQPASAVPDSVENSNGVENMVFFDEIAKKQFKIQTFDIAFSRQQHVPLPNTFYVRRIKENFAWLYYDGNFRETTCVKTGERVMTTLPRALDSRIISEKAYEKLMY